MSQLPPNAPRLSRRLAAACMTVGLCVGVGGGPAFGTPYTPAPRSSAPNTDNCPNALVPPAAVSTSERLRPGAVAPTPPPSAPKVFQSCGVTAPKSFKVPKTTASAWMVFNIDTGEVYATKDPHGRYRPASVIKVLLALEALEKLDLDARYTATAADENQIGSAVGLKEGLTYTNRQLLYGLLLNSGNDAAHALAAQLGTDAQVITMINERAHTLGAVETYAASYSGLDAPGMMTTAYDLALIYKAAWANPTFAAMVNTDYVTYPLSKDPKETFQVWNDNGLFMNDEHGIGGKTGYTDDANHTFVGAKDIGGTRIAAVILDSTIDEGRPWQQAQRLIDAAYKSKETVGVVAFRTPDPLSPSPTPAAPTPNSSASPSTAASSTAPSSSSTPNQDATKALSWDVLGVVGAGFAALALLGAVVWRLGRPRKRS